MRIYLIALNVLLSPRHTCPSNSFTKSKLWSDCVPLLIGSACSMGNRSPAAFCTLHHQRAAVQRTSAGNLPP